MIRVNLKILISFSKFIIEFCKILYKKLRLYLQSGDLDTNMSLVSSKRMIRIEKRKKKMAALLEITKLNEEDRIRSASNNLSTEPCSKRPRTDFELLPSTPTLTINPKNLNCTTEIGPTGKPILHGEEYLELKRLLKERENIMKQQPKFRLRDAGDVAVLATGAEERIPLFLCDIQHLVMYSQVGVHSPYSPARWCHLEKFNKLKHTNVIIVENLSLYHYQSYESLFSFLTKNFTNKLEMITPGAYRGDVVQDLATVPLSMGKMRQFINQYGTLEKAVIQSSELYDRLKDLFPMENQDKVGTISKIALPVGDKFSRTLLLLSGWQMVEENYPLPIKGLMETKFAGYVLTNDSYKDVTSASPMFGLDCEMCRTTIGDLELTRVSIVNEKCEVFYEELVKPDNQIVDYLTRFSGITHKMMKQVTKKLKDVQEDLRRLLPPDAILVGQSLGNDLHALKMMHPYCIDTSIIYNITGDRRRKTKLQTLAFDFLNIRIQDSRSGHCSIEDSSASMKLTTLKLSRDIHFGDAVMSDIATQVKHHPELGHANYATSMLKQTTRIEKNALVVSLENIAERYKYFTYKDQDSSDDQKIRFVTANSNKKVIKKLCANMDDSSLNLAHLTYTDMKLESDTPKVCKEIDGWIEKIYTATKKPALFTVIFGGQKQSGNGCCFITIK